MQPTSAALVLHLASGPAIFPSDDITVRALERSLPALIATRGSVILGFTGPYNGPNFRVRSILVPKGTVLEFRYTAQEGLQPDDAAIVQRASEYHAAVCSERALIFDVQEPVANDWLRWP